MKQDYCCYSVSVVVYMENAKLIVSKVDGSTSSVGRCSACQETFTLSPSAAANPLLTERGLREVFENHVKEKHSWRADANQTAALRLRKMMQDWEG